VTILDRFIRKTIPSVARLSYASAFRVPVNIISKIANLFFPEFRNLPPAHLRARVGVGNRIVFNQSSHISAGEKFWVNNLLEGFCSRSSNIVEIGCGCGRILRPLFESAKYQGRYIGIDVDREMLEWCEKHYKKEGFSYIKSPHDSTAYGVGATSDRGYPATSGFWKVPIADNTIDFVFSTSLFTHLLEAELANYVRESYRVLKEGCYMKMGFFSYDSVEKGERWTFLHRMGDAYVENSRIPQAAVAYADQTLLRYCFEAGFRESRIDSTTGQSLLICRK